MRKIPFAGIELTSQRVRGLRGTSELPGRPAFDYVFINLFSYVLKCFVFVLVWCPSMATNVKVYSMTVGFSAVLLL